MSCPSRAFQSVFRRLSTGGLYTWARFPLRPGQPDHKTIGGKPSFLLVPVFRLFVLENENPASHQEVADFPRDNWNETVSVGEHEKALYFEPMPTFRAVQNSDLAQLLAEYSEEGLTSNPEQLSRLAHRYARTMEDSQARCLLELMARVLDALPGPATQAPVAAHGPLEEGTQSVVK